MRYFVTEHSVNICSNLSKKEAVSLAIHICNKKKTSTGIGVGKIKYINGKRYYTCLPFYYSI